MVRWLSGQKLKINFAINNDRIFKLFWQSHQKQANITNIIQEIYFFKIDLYFELKEISGWIRNSSEKKIILFNAFDFFYNRYGRKDNAFTWANFKGNRFLLCDDRFWWLIVEASNPETTGARLV